MDDDDILKQLRLAELWFCSTRGDEIGNIPVARQHGKWLFQTAADTIERQRLIIRTMQAKLDVAQGYLAPEPPAFKGRTY